MSNHDHIGALCRGSFQNLIRGVTNEYTGLNRHMSLLC